MPSGYKFVIADDHPLFRGALKQALAGIADVATILEAGDFEATKALVAANEDVDLVLLDLSMPGASGLSGLISLRGIHSAVPMVVVSAHDDAETIRRALELGASGFISKSASMEEIRAAVTTVLFQRLRQPVSRQEALVAHTRSNAFVLFQESRLGSIEAGKLADMIVLDRDYFSVPADQIKDIQSVLTVAGGRVAFDGR